MLTTLRSALSVGKKAPQSARLGSHVVDPVDNADATDRVDTRAGTAYDVTCPAREVLELIASKWTVLVVDALADGPERYSALRREITGVSQKMLTQTLRELERDGIVIRTVYDTKPPSVEVDERPPTRSLVITTGPSPRMAARRAGGTRGSHRPIREPRRTGRRHAVR
jgi:DNA-binding HxlR family transcriptional regulator